MSLIAAWATLVLCVVLAALRIPAALQGRNLPALAAFVLVSAVIALAIPPIYLTVDGLLGAVNITNLISHLILNAAFIVIGVRVAAAVASKPARQLIIGPWGKRIFLLSSAAIVSMFFLADVPAPSMGLNAYADQFWVEMYRLAGRIYPAFVAVALIPASLKAFRTTFGVPLLRTASGCFALGFSLVSVLPLVQLAGMWLEVAPLVDMIIYPALMLVAVAPTLTWVSKRLHAKQQQSLIAHSG